MKIQNLLVVDSSVAAKWLIVQDELYIRQADKILADTKDGLVKLLMPELAQYEIGNVLINKKLRLSDVKEALNFFYKIPISFYKESYKLAILTAQIAFKYGITFYDAAFIALAKVQKAVLVTDNPKHQKKYQGKEVKVIPLKNYK